MNVIYSGSVESVRVICCLLLGLSWAEYEAKYPVLTGIQRV